MSVEFDVGGFYPVTFNDKDLVKRLTPSLREAAENKVYEMTPSTGAEDFSFFSNEIPGMYFWLEKCSGCYGSAWESFSIFCS